MPARKSARKSRTKSFKRCSRLGEKKCRSRKSCGFSSRRTPKCQPKKSRRGSRTRRRSSRRTRTSSKRMKRVSKGSLMTKGDLADSVKTVKCRTSRSKDGKCVDDCLYDPRKRMCVPTVTGDNPAGKFMDGTRYLTFRSGRKPAFSFKIPINKETLFGDYAGAIRWSPATGKLHLCYGPVIDSAGTEKSKRPVLSMMVKEKIVKDLWSWYTSQGLTLQKKRIRETPADQLVYAELYALPGASIQLSWSECMFLEDAIMKSDATGKEKGLKLLAEPPSECPKITGENNPADGCFPKDGMGGRYDEEQNTYAQYRRQFSDDNYDAYQVLGGRPKLSEREKMFDELIFDDDEETCSARKKMRKVARPSKMSPQIPKQYMELSQDLSLPPVLAKERERVRLPYGRSAVEDARRRRAPESDEESEVVGVHASLGDHALGTGLEDGERPARRRPPSDAAAAAPEKGPPPPTGDAETPKYTTTYEALSRGSGQQMYQKLTEGTIEGEAQSDAITALEGSTSLKGLEKLLEGSTKVQERFLLGSVAALLCSVAPIKDAPKLSLDELEKTAKRLQDPSDFPKMDPARNTAAGYIGGLTMNPTRGNNELEETRKGLSERQKTVMRGQVIKPCIVLASLTKAAEDGTDATALMSTINILITGFVGILKALSDRYKNIRQKGNTPKEKGVTWSAGMSVLLMDLIAARLNIRVLRAVVYDLQMLEGRKLGGNGVTGFEAAFSIPEMAPAEDPEAREYIENYKFWEQGTLPMPVPGGTYLSGKDFAQQAVWEVMGHLFSLTTESGNPFKGDRAENKIMRRNNQERNKLYQVTKQASRRFYNLYRLQREVCESELEDLQQQNQRQAHDKRYQQRQNFRGRRYESESSSSESDDNY